MTIRWRPDFYRPLIHRYRIFTMPIRQHMRRCIAVIVCVAVGVLTTAMALGLSHGADQKLSAIAENSGANVLAIRAATLRAYRPGKSWYSATTLNVEDVRNLQIWLPGAQVSPIIELTAPARFGGRRTITTIRGTSAAYLDMRRLRIEFGRPMNDDDARARARVAMLGYFSASRLGSPEDLVGSEISIRGVPFTVIAILGKRGAGADGSNEDDQIVIPAEVAALRLDRRDYLNAMLIEPVGTLSPETSINRIRVALRESHHLKSAAEDDFEILSPARESEIKRMQRQMLRALAILFAFITNFVGCIGIFSVTHLNVQSRTSEMGLRKALGATHSDILQLILMESWFLGGSGGVLGTILAGLTALGLRIATHWEISLGIFELGVPMAAAAAVGIIAGLLPAFRALRLAPAVVLRS